MITRGVADRELLCVGVVESKLETSITNLHGLHVTRVALYSSAFTDGKVFGCMAIISRLYDFLDKIIVIAKFRTPDRTYSNRVMKPWVDL